MYLRIEEKHKHNSFGKDKVYITSLNFYESLPFLREL